MQQEKPSAVCGGLNGSLPGACGSLAFPYVAMQSNTTDVYSQNEALVNGTLFPGLNLPFHRAMESKMQVQNKPLCELMALDFAITELGLYLDTHKDDAEAFALFQQFSAMEKAAKAAYESKYGPVTAQAAATGDSFQWLSDSWPWNYSQNEVN